MIIDFLGDSITEGAGASSMDNCFVSQTGKLLNAKANNYGISGTRIARQKGVTQPHIFDMHFPSRMDFLDRNADVIVVMGGTNDFGHGNADFGEMSDYTTDTFCGAFNVLTNGLMRTYGRKKLLFVLPLHRFTEDDKNPVTGKILKDYVDAEREILKNKGIKYLDLFCDEQLPKPEKAGQSEFFADGLHPNDKGHRLLAEKVADFIRKEYL